MIKSKTKFAANTLRMKHASRFLDKKKKWFLKTATQMHLNQHAKFVMIHQTSAAANVKETCATVRCNVEEPCVLNAKDLSA